MAKMEGQLPEQLADREVRHDEPKPDEPKASQDDPLKGTPYEGKSPTEIAKMHQELESKLGTQSEEVGQLRKQVEQFKQQETQPSGFEQPEQQQYQNPFEQPTQQPMQQTPQPQPQEELADDDYYTGKQVKDYVNKRMFDYQMRDSYTKGTEAMEEVARDNPEQWKEVGQQTVNWMNNAFYTGQLHPTYYGSKRGWKWALDTLWVNKYGLGKSPQEVKETASQPATQPTGMPPVGSETPTATRPPAPEGEIKLSGMDDLTRELVSKRPEGMSEQEFLKKVREEQGRG